MVATQPVAPEPASIEKVPRGLAVLPVDFVWFEQTIGTAVRRGTGEAEPEADETCSKPPIFVRSPVAPYR